MVNMVLLMALENLDYPSVKGKTKILIELLLFCVTDAIAVNFAGVQSYDTCNVI